MRSVMKRAGVRVPSRASWRWPTSSRRTAFLLWGAVVVIVVAAVELALRANHPVWFYADDTPSYIFASNNMLYQTSVVDFYRGPGYPLMMAVAAKLAGASSFALLYLAQQALWVLSALEVFAIAGIITRRPAVAGIVALLAGANFYPLSYANLLLAEGLCSFLVATLALAVVVCLRHPRPLALWGVTIACLALMLTLSEWFLFPVLIFGYLAWMLWRRGLLRALLAHLLGGLATLLAVTGLYVYANGALNGYYGLSFIQNPSLFAKVLQYQMTGAGPAYAALDQSVRQYITTPAGINPWEYGYLHPEVSRDYWALAGNYARAVILHHPVQYVLDTIPLIFNPPVYWGINFVDPGGRFASLLSAFQWIGQYSYGLLPFAVFFAAVWVALLVIRPTSRMLTVEAMGAIALIVCFDHAITVATSYSDYQRIQMPTAQLAIVLTFGTFVLLFAVVADLLARARGEATGERGALATGAGSEPIQPSPDHGSGQPILVAPAVPARAGAANASGIESSEPTQQGGLMEAPDYRSDKHVVIMGAGPAGLTAAYELTRHGVPALVLEQDPRFVGGISRTEERQGYRFDIGGHRFFSKSQEIEDFWTEVAGDLLLTRGRLSRIYYQGKYFAYPLKAGNALRNMGPVETVRCMASYAWAKLRPVKDPQNLEDWVSNQFGHRLFSIFFKTYTEKVWGINTKDLSADWAAQRIKGLDLGQAIKSALPHPRRRGQQAADRGAVIKTLIDEFRYPRLGPGQLWERVRDRLAAAGQHVVLGQQVVAICHDGTRITSVLVRDVATGEERSVAGSDFLSTLPVRELVRRCVPPLPEPVQAAAGALKYRDFLTVAVVIDRAEMFPDNWIYIHDPSVQVGRMQNFKNWSPEMVPDPATTCLGLEYFCFAGDGLWESPDAELVELARRELAQLGMCRPEEVRWGAVVRQPKAYPVYDDEYKQHLAVVRDYLREHLPNLALVGRNGMHHYNNQDHSMMTALLAARNIALGTSYDPWKVNTDAEYHEEARLDDEDRSGRQMPARVASLARVEK